MDHKAIKLSTYGINFVGTPHQGGSGVGLGKVVLDIVSAVKHTNKNTVGHLAKHSEFLQHQQSQYLAISGDFETVCFYEEYRTHLPGVGHKLAGISVPATKWRADFGCFRSFQDTQLSFKASQIWKRLLSAPITSA